MLSLTLLVPPSRSQSVIDVLTALDGVHTVVRVPAATVQSGDDLLAAAVEPGVADLVLQRLTAAGDSRLSLTYLVTMAIAGFIASIGAYDISRS